MDGSQVTMRESEEGLHGLFARELGEPRGRGRLLRVHAPGRSEIAGNHTDHEGGHVIAGALDVAVDALARPNGTSAVRLASKGYPTVEVALDNLEVREDEKNTTSALVRGMAFRMTQDGRKPEGFDMAMTSTIPIGGGLSSSAAVEAALGRAMEALWEGRSYDALEMARMCQFSENVYFGKPCGLMDQASVCLGGLAFIDFAIPEDPRARRLELDFEDLGYALCLVDVGSGHADLTDAYAAMPQEMQAVAAAFGKHRLCEVDGDDFDAHVPELRRDLGDRAVLRAIHYWRENKLVDKRWEALNEPDIDAFLAYTRTSGASSAMFLQNVSCGIERQPAMVALGLAERVLDGRGATRIHGGGFGGTIQCFVPLDLVEEFKDRMDAWLGAGSCRHYRISDRGALAQWE
ncbi:galactokinase family protein [Olsenella sp. Marseille-P4559]|uniref:galactokinase n=1 Tax=Olsenella sp. Marseille-P4559 TaxID=2364795 RepID=UPI001F5FA11C|nr:galactokinase family protein [Olsenella sp. Marseille-P4559]